MDDYSVNQRDSRPDRRFLHRDRSINASVDMHRSNYGSISAAENDALIENQDETSVPSNQGCCLARLYHRITSPSQPDTLEHALSNEFESLDYEDFHNKIYVAQEVDKGHSFVLKRGFFRWLVMFFIGCLTACVAVSIDISIERLSSLKHSVIQIAYRRFTETDPFPTPLFVWVALNCVLVMIAAVLVAYFAPVAAGSGIPQIKCYLNGVKIPKVVRIKTLICKVVGVTCSVAGGLAVGKEGPMIHSGAVIAAGISQGRSTTLKKDFKIFEYFRNDHEKRDFVSGGAAAGVSAAFGAPVGGVLFSLEEGASFWNQALTWRIFFCSIISYFFLNFFLSIYSGKPGELQYQGLLNFGSFDNLNYQIWEIPLMFIPIGVVGGLLGALFNAINIKLTKFRLRNVRRTSTKIVEAMMVAGFSASVFFVFIYFQKDCHPYDENEIESPVQAFCDDGQVSSVASLLLQTPEKSVRKLFHAPMNTYNVQTLGVFFLIYFFLALWTYGLSVPSGLFIPCLLLGASWGRLYARFITTAVFYFNQSIDLSIIDPGKYALVGAAAQLGGVVRMTISLTVILMEATGNVTFGLPLMIVLMVAKWVGDLFTEGIYDEHIGLAKVPILGWDAPPITSHRRAVEVMSTPVTVFRPIEKVSVVLKYLKMYKHNGFPIVTNYDPDMVDAVTMETYEARRSDSGNVPKKKLRRFGRLVGFVNRSQIIVLLKRLHFLENFSNDDSYADSLNPNVNPSPSATAAGTASSATLHRRCSHGIPSQPSQHSLFSVHSENLPPLNCEDFRDAYPRYPDINSLSIPETLMGCHIDFRPYMNDSPYHMNYRATLPRLFALFRALGLRHVTITDNLNYVVGMVTRVDIARFREVWSYGSDHTHEVLPIAKRAD